jgi:FkbM family methyltransferase
VKLIDNLTRTLGSALLYLFYLKDLKNKEPVWTINNAKFITRRGTSDRLTIWETWKKNQYTSNGFGIAETDVVVDIGSNIGAFTVYAAKKAEKGRVYSYEPHPGNFELLNKNITLNKLRNTKTFRTAISKTKGKTHLSIGDWSTGTHCITNNPKSKTIKVDSIRLKDVFTENKLGSIDFLKMDCEGGEYEIFKSTSKKYLKRIKKISLEFHPPKHKFERLKNKLERAGFKIKTEKLPFIKIGILKAKR